MKRQILALFPMFVLSVGCSDITGSGEEATVDWKGNYLVEGTWDMSSPFSSERSFGDAFAELLTSKIVSGAGVPDAVTEEAEELVLELIGDSVRGEVNSNTPDHLKTGSPLMDSLTETMGSVRVVSEVSLEEGSLLDDLAGSEKIVSFEFTKGQEVHVLTPELLAKEGVPNFTIEAEWEGTEDGNVLSVDEHPFELRYGNIVSWVLLNVITDQGGDDLSAAAASAIGCPTLVADIVGNNDGFFVEVAGDEYGLGSDGLTSACEAAIGNVGERAVGLFTLDAKVTTGGSIQVIDADGDGKADRLESLRDYGGFISVAPEPIAPRLGVSFVANRQ